MIAGRRGPMALVIPAFSGCADDLTGRRLGATVGVDAWGLASSYFGTDPADWRLRR